MFHLHQGSKKLEIRTISVAFATDDNYLAPTLVAVKSIALHATNGYGYAIYILSDHPLGAINKKMFLSAVKNFGNVTITFIAVGHKLGSVRLSETGPAKGITAATYFRFLLPDLL